MASPRAGRAPRIPAPGAPRVTFEGYVAVPDDFGRLRFLLPPAAAAALRRAVPDPPGAPPAAAGWRSARGLPVDVALVVWAVPDARRRAFWHSAAAAARGRWVRAEVTTRRYAFAGAGPRCRGRGGASGIAGEFADLGVPAGGTAGAGDALSGTAFDLVFFEEVPEPAGL